MYYEGGKAPEREETEHYEGAQLRAYLDRRGVEYSDFAKMIGKSKNTVQSYFKSETLNKSNKASILAALNAKYEDVFGKLGFTPIHPKSITIQPVNVIENNDNTLLDILEVPAFARSGLGYARFFTEPMTERQFTKVPHQMLQEGVSPDDHLIVSVQDDSMQPILMPGYRMLAYKVQTNRLPALNSIILVDYRQELLIKELSDIDDVSNTIVLRSRNGGSTRRISLTEVKAVYHIYRYFDAQLTV
ncbi:hypothetical protein GCM10028810_01580 [Spirosoma litoris]